MTKKQQELTLNQAQSSKITIDNFSIDRDPTSISSIGLTEYFNSELVDEKYYEPPVNLQNIYQLQFSSPHHSSAIAVKKNSVSTLYISNAILPKNEFNKALYEYLLYGNCFFERIMNRGGGLVSLKHMPTLYTRRGKKENEFYWLENENGSVEAKKLNPDSIIHLKSYDSRQEIYGLPEYLSAYQAIKLNEEATLFRRKYYLNGAHMGFILYLNSANMTDDEIKIIKDELKKSKGAGNFKNMFIHNPNGNKDSIQLMPVGSMATKDEFMNIKDASMEDILAIHRVPPVLMCILPDGKSGGFGDAEKAYKVFHMSEVMSLQEKFKELNDILGTAVIDFAEPKLFQPQETKTP